MCWPTAATSSGEEVLAWVNPLASPPTCPSRSPQRSKAKGRLSASEDFYVYVADDDVYRCPSGERLTRHFSLVEDGMTMHVLLDHQLRRLSDQAAMHDRPGAPHQALGTVEAVIDRHAGAARSNSARHAHPPRHRRTPLRHAQGVDGRYPLPHQDPPKGQNGDEPPRSGLQSEADDRDSWRPAADAGDPGLSGPAIPHAQIETRP